MANNERKFRYSCVRCKKEFFDRADNHLARCKSATENIDYIKCKLCDHKGLALYSHIKKHNLTVEEYENQYGSTICKNSIISISLRNSIIQHKSNYRNRLKKENRIEELIEFNKTTSKSVSKTVMSNNAERIRRSNLLSALNKTEQFRKKASETAIKTSARKDIQQQRTLQLKRWREENPESFLEQCKKICSYQTSRPEAVLFSFCKEKNILFKNNVQLVNNSFLLNKTNRRQIDIFDKKNKIIVEFDGKFHFMNISKWNQLENVKLKDDELNSLSSEFCIIRVGYDQFSYRKSDYGFKKKCLECLDFLIFQNNKGLYKLGEVYGKDNFLQTDWQASNIRFRSESSRSSILSC